MYPEAGLRAGSLRLALCIMEIKEGSSWTIDTLAERLGGELVLRMQRATDAAVEQVDLTVASCASLVADFHRAMKARFPNETIIRMAPDAPSDQLLQPTSVPAERS